MATFFFSLDNSFQASYRAGADVGAGRLQFGDASRAPPHGGRFHVGERLHRGVDRPTIGGCGGGTGTCTYTVHDARDTFFMSADHGP